MEETWTKSTEISPESVSDKDLKKKIEDTGKLIQEKYCFSKPNRPTMLPPIPNCSKFIDKFPEEGCSKDNQKDKRNQEAYAAEVKVYRALERLEDEIVVLHSLHYTNRQLKLFKKDHNILEDKPNREVGECDFVVIGRNYVVVIEVSDVRINDGITPNKRVKNTFKNKKKQAGRTRELIEHMIKDVSRNLPGGPAFPNIKWYCAFPSITFETGAELFDEEQKRNIIFSDFIVSLDGANDHEINFQHWWTDKVKPCETLKVSHGPAKEYFDEKISIKLKDFLIGLWNIDSQNEINPENRCSFGSNIMRVDSQLRHADITYGFRNPERPEFNNPNFVEADHVFNKGIGIKYLTKEQDEIFKSNEQFLWVNGPAGSGKTILILGKAIQAAKSGENAVIFTNGSGLKSTDVYHRTLIKAEIPFDSFTRSEVEAAVTTWSFKVKIDMAKKLYLRSRDPCCIILLPSLSDSSEFRLRSRRKESLKLIKSIISKTIALGGKYEHWNFFVDDEQFLLVDECYDSREENMREIKELAETNDNCSIWVFSDITQSFKHTGPENFDSLLASMDSMKQTYSHLMLSLNLRNTFDIAKILSILREHTLISTEQQESHFIHGPVPTIYFVDDTGYAHGIYNCIEGIIGKELDKILDSHDIQVSDIGFICNNNGRSEYENMLCKIVKSKTNEKWRGCVVNLKHTYSTEWPVVIFLMDLGDVDEFDYTILHQLYLGLSRARVYCVTVILSSTNRSNSLHILKKFENLAELRYHSRKEDKFLQGLNIPTPEKESECALQYAIRQGKANNVRDVIASGVDVNRGTEMGTPLHFAIDQGKLDVVRLLVDYGADVNSRDSYENTPLHFAVDSNDLDMVKYLVEHGADLNCRDMDNISPLHYAVDSNDFELVRYLVDSGADLNCRDSNDKTPLHYAIYFDHNEDIVRYSLESGAE